MLTQALCVKLASSIQLSDSDKVEAVAWMVPAGQGLGAVSCSYRMRGVKVCRLDGYCPWVGPDTPSLSRKADYPDTRLIPKLSESSSGVLCPASGI